MYVRDARNREEVWLLDHIEAMALDETAFRSRDYVIAIEEDSGIKAGFGRIRVHTTEDGDEICELTSIGVLDGWRNQGVGAHILERLVEYVGDRECDEAYVLCTIPDYFSQFGFAVIDDDDLPTPLVARLAPKRDRHEEPVVPMRLDVASFEMPERLRARFKQATQKREEEADDTDPHDLAEEFGIDPDKATYKYDPRGGNP